MTARIEQTMQFLRNSLLSEDSISRTSKEQMLYRYNHSLRVACHAKTIAEAENLNSEALIIACLLHDIAYCKYDKSIDWRCHGHISADISKPFVKELGLNSQTQQNILFGISAHVTGDANVEGERNPFTESVSDCDNLDRFDAFRIYDAMAGDNFRDMELQKQLEFIDKKLALLSKYIYMDFATNTATKMWKQRIEFQQEYYTKLKAQLSVVLF